MNLKTFFSKTKNSYSSVVFGHKPFDNCFDYGLSEEKYVELLRFVKNQEKWELISKKNIKIFYYYDLKLIVDDKSNMQLEKDVVSYYRDLLDKDNNGIRVINYMKVKNMDLNIFPGLDKIHDIRKIREIIFKKNDIIVKFFVINHSNKDITFEMIIDFQNEKNIQPEINKFLTFFNYDELTTYNVSEMNNKDKFSKSII